MSQEEPYQPITLTDIRKFVDNKLVDTGIPGMLLGIAVAQLLAGQWLQSGLFVVAATVSWLLIKVLKKVAPKVDQLVDQAVEKTGTRVEVEFINRSGFESQYLEALKHHCHNLKVEGFQGYLPRLVLDKVYVPLRLVSRSSSLTGSRTPAQQIWELLPKGHDAPKVFPHRLMAIVAKPGYGKTTLSRHLTLSYANGTYQDYGVQSLIPVLLLFREFHNQIQASNTPTLPDLIASTVQQLARCQELRTSGSWFKDRLEQGECLVIFDGLDEVPEAQREQVSQWANWQMQNYASQFILTSRPHGYQADLFDGVEQVEILDFTNDEKQDFIEQWYRFITWELIWKRNLEESQRDADERKRLSEAQAQAESDTEAQNAAADLSRQLFASRDLSDLAKNPLLITIIVATHEAYSLLPKRRVDLYQKILSLLLEYRPQRRRTRLTLPTVEANQTVLKTLAFSLTQAKSIQFTPQQGVAWIRTVLQSVLPPETVLSPIQFFTELQQIAGVLVGGESHLYEFSHKTFQEYLTALYLKDCQEAGEEELLTHLSDPNDSNWREVICFYAAMSDATRLVQGLLEHPEPDQLELARRLKDEAKEIDAQVVEQLNQILSTQTTIAPNILLEQRFQTLHEIDAERAISDWITWGEYQLFLQDQAAGQFHSKAEQVPITPEQATQPVTDIRPEDGRWFCAWLSTQAHLQPESGVFHYRLPQDHERQEPMQHHAPQNRLRVVRVQIPERYQALLNYLANGRWREADEETDRVMLDIAKRTDAGYLRVEDIERFPCPDLRCLDELWVKFSGGHFGFSVQKQIWQECGSPKAYNKDWETFGTRVGWRVNNEWRGYGGDFLFSTDALRGHLPRRVFVAHRAHLEVGGSFLVSSLAHRLVNCSTQQS